MSTGVIHEDIDDPSDPKFKLSRKRAFELELRLDDKKDETTSSAITPLIHGRYAKMKEHWNTVTKPVAQDALDDDMKLEDYKYNEDEAAK